ncbi:hypothetical protein ACJX0J_006967, partial [Zea mays]
ERSENCATMLRQDHFSGLEPRKNLCCYNSFFSTTAASPLLVETGPELATK